ncbi:receptor-type guanylate cyclase Gyc76C [Camponotus floridanus]|uniref:receptor-type guanylate cyclase Gyc76C n=1 Tax=Camponotus floridanus TaxID=104421 RepID=UPI00059C184A|nr:receptor-type guanylate cyclase Gyc76C [Camponotus floridanus]XP_025270230.1 receptor-type guanylate cyclase Gyc76C [Camponotus floridanus]
MRPGPPAQPSRRRSPRRQHPRQQQLHRERDRKQRQERHRPSHPLPRPRPRALLVLLLLASSPLVLSQALEPPAESPASPPVQCHQVPSHKNLWSGGNKTAGQPLNLTIGYLTAIKGDLKDRQGLAISGALSMALDEVNNDENILPNVKLVMRWNDTRGETTDATSAMIDMICEGVVAFFGPEGSCHVEAIVAQSRNIPMLSYKCSDYKASKVKAEGRTFVRTEPPDTQVTKSVIALLLHYGWNKFTIVSESAWSTVARSLQEQATKNNLTVNHYKIVEDRHTCCEERLPCCQVSVWFQLIQETKNMTRIYIFFGTPMSLIDMMSSMQGQRLLDDGEYMVIHVDMMMYSQREAQKYLWKPEDFDKAKNCLEPKDFLKKARSLMVVVSTPPTQNYGEFTKKVQEYSSKEPFNFVIPPLLRKYEKYVSIYAAYLYDSLKLYARALDQLMRDLPNQSVEELAKNGTLIIETIIKNRTYQSVSGATIKLDKFGDSEGNFSVLALKKEPFIRDNFSCDYQMLPVGQFLQGETLVYKPWGAMEWPSKTKPEAEPGCGFHNEHCPKDDTHYRSIIAAVVLGIALFCAAVITISIYRRWKIEQEIEGLLWKIDMNDIHGYPHLDNMMSSPSKLSLVSAMSYESRCGGQVFAQTGHYHGVVVRIKELKFSKKKDISRDVMKEMRILREIRHGNLNSFIGACVEPMRILLITDYCAKGSLYDIIENEDIKLDDMFIASLVHDLIKGMLYIHESSVLVCHGNLKSSNCVVTSRWVLQVCDFGLHDMRHCAESDSIGEHQYYRSLFWKAPELLRNPHASIRGTQEGDIYSFAIILYEILGRKGPYGNINLEPKEIIDRVKKFPEDGEPPFRPNLNILSESKANCADYVIGTIMDCWAESPELRPDFKTIRTRLKKMKAGWHRNIMDQMMNMMEKYASNLEDLVTERTGLLLDEKKKTEDLLHRMLPKPVANCLTNGIGVEPEAFDLVTIYFSDIVGFTAMSAESTPFQVVNFLNDLYTLFDRIIRGYEVYKVETIGDAYMVVSGLPIRNGDQHAGQIASMSLELLNAVKHHTIPHRPQETLKLRIGIHTGPVVAGVVGLTMPRYCLFGDTVNTASRMESTGEPLRIHISKQCKEALEKIGGYQIEERGFVEMKGKGTMKTYWLTGATVTHRKNTENFNEDENLPPLFCRPRRSPKLNPDSRYASLLEGLGAGSRRHSRVPYPADDSSSQYGGSSPVPRSLHARKLEKSPLSLTESVSKSTLDNISIQEEGVQRHFNIKSLDDLFISAGPKYRKNARALSTIASSSSSDYPSQTVIRESRSLDPIPSDIYNKRFESSNFWKENECTRTDSKMDILEKMLNNNYPNGNVIMPHTDNLSNEADPLLGDNSEGKSEIREKRSRSLDQVVSASSMDSVPDKKSSARKLLEIPPVSTIIQMFNGNGLRNSNHSLRRGIIPGYDKQNERESVV